MITTDSPRAGTRLTRWLERWGPILPLLGAEFILIAGFGAVLPVLPLYFTEHGVDIPTLGLVVAAWPAARLVTEPVFGWLADRTRRTPLMVAGLVLSAIFVVGPLFLVGPIAFVALRALAGAASAIYDPAARGYLMDATPSDRHGEAFGLYSAAQNAGFIFGPVIGGIAAALTGDVRAVFVVGGAGILVAAVVVALAVHERPRIEKPHPDAGPTGAAGSPQAPRTLWNRALIAAVVLNFGNFFAGGVWEVIWSLYMVARGGDLTWIGITFAIFGLPILIVSPIVGGLVDRRGPIPFIAGGTLLAVVTSLLYVPVRDLTTIAVIVFFEGLAWALVAPALYAIVGRGTPTGRSATAQGVFGASGTLGYIVASAVAGQLFALSIDWPFYLIAVMVSATFVIAFLIAGPIAPSRVAVPAPRPSSAEVA